MGVTARQFVDKALSYEGYREKNHANANLEDFYNDAGDGNHTLFQQISVGWTGDQWCQYFVDGIAVMLTGSREAAKELLCQENNVNRQSRSCKRAPLSGKAQQNDWLYS